MVLILNYLLCLKCSTPPQTVALPDKLADEYKIYLPFTVQLVSAFTYQTEYTSITHSEARCSAVRTATKSLGRAQRINWKPKFKYSSVNENKLLGSSRYFFSNDYCKTTINELMSNVPTGKCPPPIPDCFSAGLWHHSATRGYKLQLHQKRWLLKR